MGKESLPSNVLNVAALLKDIPEMWDLAFLYEQLPLLPLSLRLVKFCLVFRPVILLEVTSQRQCSVDTGCRPCAMQSGDRRPTESSG